MKPIIEVKNLSKKYRLGEIQPYYTLRDSLAGVFKNPFAAVKAQLNKDEFWALKDINFEVNQGEVVGIIGRNGAGKSTLLKILSQITPPTEGEVILRGRVGSLLEVGTGFSPELTGRENIYLNGAVLGMKKSEVKKKFDEIVAFSEVEKFLDTPLKHYSSGMYMRLAFAVAAHLEPEILIVDEVLAVGDAEFQKKCLGKMGEVAGEGRTVLFVSHNMGAISNLCSKGIVLSDGEISAIGNIRNCIKTYSSKIEKFNGKFNLEGNKKRKNSLTDSNFKWISATVKNSLGEITSNIHISEPFSVICEGILLRNESKLSFGFGVMNDMGISLFNNYAEDSNVDHSFKAGKITFQINFDQNIFAPGNYTFDLAANGKHTTDWIPEALVVQIMNAYQNPGLFLRQNFNGLVIYPCTWKVLDS